MKFSKLVDKFEKIVRKDKQGKRIKAQKLANLQQLLGEKISRYQARLDATKDPGKRKKLETRLRVVNAQRKKSRKLSAAD